MLLAQEKYITACLIPKVFKAYCAHCLNLNYLYNWGCGYRKALSQRPYHQTAIPLKNHPEMIYNPKYFEVEIQPLEPSRWSQS